MSSALQGSYLEELPGTGKLSAGQGNLSISIVAALIKVIFLHLRTWHAVSYLYVYGTYPGQLVKGLSFLLKLGSEHCRDGSQARLMSFCRQAEMLQAVDG